MYFVRPSGYQPSTTVRYNLKPGYILNEDTQPVIRVIGVSHTACKDEFDKVSDLTARVYFHL